jgi:hypothetical protein
MKHLLRTPAATWEMNALARLAGKRYAKEGKPRIIPIHWLTFTKQWLDGYNSNNGHMARHRGATR